MERGKRGKIYTPFSFDLCKLIWKFGNKFVYLIKQLKNKIMAKYFEVSVSVNHEVDGGKGGVKIKKVKESYLVDAMTVTEAEARVVKQFEESGVQLDYEVTGARESKIIQVID